MQLVSRFRHAQPAQVQLADDERHRQRAPQHRRTQVAGWLTARAQRLARALLSVRVVTTVGLMGLCGFVLACVLTARGVVTAHVGLRLILGTLSIYLLALAAGKLGGIQEEQQRNAYRRRCR